MHGNPDRRVGDSGSYSPIQVRRGVVVPKEEDFPPMMFG